MVPNLLQRLAGLLARTWRLDIVGDDHVRQLRSQATPIVFAVWHGQLLAPLWHRRHEGITLLVSGHTDGQYLSGAAIGWGYQVIRGSSTRGGVGALRGILRVLGNGGDVAFAPDGPRGPAQLAKQGAVAVASRRGAAIVPVGAVASSAWTLRSWDRFSIPRPFSKVRIVYGLPIRIASARAREGVAQLGAALTAASQSATC